MQLIRTNALRALTEAEVGSVPITDRWNEISALLTERCGSDVSQLFAEPSISRSNGVSESTARWYSDADGPAVSFSALDPAGRAAASAHLTSILARLEPLLRDPKTASLIGPCVQIPSMADVMVVGVRPVIVNWGYLPEAIASSQGQREAHFRTTLGQYLPGASVPAFNTGRAPVLGPVPPAPAVAPAFAVAPAVAAAATVVPPIVATEMRRDRSWVPVAIATAVALIVLLILLIPGVLMYPDRTGMAAGDIERIRQSNSDLQARIDELNRQLSQAVCTAQNPAGTPAAVPVKPPVDQAPAVAPDKPPSAPPDKK